MPILTEEQKRQGLLSRGYDPDKYEARQEGDNVTVVPRVSQIQPTTAEYSGLTSQSELTDKIVTTAEEPTQMGSFGRGVASGVLPTVGGLGTGMVTGAAAGSLLGPVGTFVGGLAGAMGGGALVSSLQDKVMPESWRQTLAKDQEVNPYSSMLGNIASSAIAMKPDIRALKGAYTGLVKDIPKSIIANTEANAANMGNLANVGINAGVGAGQDIYQQLTSADDKPFDYTQLALQTAGNAIMNNPNRIGRAMGMHPNVYAGDSIQRNNALPKDNDNINTQVKPVEPVKPEVTDAFYDSESKANETKLSPFSEKDAEGKYLRGKKEVAEELKKLETIEEDKKPVMKWKDMTEEAQRELLDQRLFPEYYANVPKKSSEPSLLNPEEMKPSPSSLDSVNAEDLATLRTDANEITKPDESVPVLSEESEVGDNPEGLISKNDLVNPRYQETQNSDENRTGIPNWLINKGLDLAKKRGVNLEFHDGQLYGADGKLKVNGMSFARKTVNDLAQALVGKGAGSDTIFHELAHPFYADMKNSTFARERSIADKMEKAIEKSEAFKKANDERIAEGKTPMDAEEFMVEHSGIETLRAIETGDNSAWKDIKSAIAVRWGNANEKDVARLFSLKLRDNKAYDSKDYKINPAIVHEDEQKNQPAKDNPQIHTEEFKKWFGDSKVVDKDGKPLVVYHGTMDPTFSKFEKVALNDVGWLGHGFYFSTKAKDAEHYAGVSSLGINNSLGNPGLYPVYISIKKPYITEGYSERHLLEGSKGRQKLESQGYDGVIAIHGKDKEIVAFRPEQIKSAIGNKGTFDSNNPDIRYQPAKSADNSESTSSSGKQDKVLNYIGSEIDRVRNIGTKTADQAATVFEKHHATLSEMLGKYVNKIVDKLRQGNSRERQRVDQYGMDMMDSNGTKSDIVLTPKEQKMYDEARQHLLEVKDDNTIRAIKENPYYWPAILSMDVAHTWNSKPLSFEAKRYDKLWIDHAVKSGKFGKDEIVARKNAAEELNKLKTVIGGEGKSNQSLEFGALRKAAGIGLPQELQDKDLLSRFSRYGTRVAKDLAFNQVIESDPVMRYALMLKDKNGKIESEAPKLPGSNDLAERLTQHGSIHNMNKFLYNDWAEVNQPKVRSLTRAFNSMLLGLPTGVRDVASIPINALPYIRATQIPLMIKAGANFANSIKPSLYMNARQNRMSNLEWGNTTSPDALSNIFNHVADGARLIQGREHMEQFARIYTFSLGKLLAIDNLGRASRGDVKAQDWLKKFGTTIEKVEDSWKTGSEVKEEMLNKFAKAFVDRNQGTFSQRGLPAVAMEGSLAPFFALSRWSLEKTGVIYKDVLVPAKKGDYMPLISYTLAGLATGEVIRRLNDLMSNKEAKEPSLAEATATGNKAQQIRAVTNLLHMASFGGLIGDVMKAGADMGNGRIPKGISFPLMDFMSDTLSKNIADYTEALKQGEDPFNTSIKLLENIVINTVQSARILANHTYRSKDIDRQNKLGDMRTFNELEGKPDATLNSMIQPNTYLGQEEKKFKQTTDLKEATQLLPTVIQKFVKQYGDNAEELATKLKGLKSNSYRTMPNFEKDSLKFAKYITYLKKTKGEEEATKRLQDYMLHKLANELKSSLVPTI